MREYRGRLILIAVLLLVGWYVECRTETTILNAPAVSQKAVDPTVVLFSGFGLESQRAAAIASKPAPSDKAARWRALACGLVLGIPAGAVAFALCIAAKSRGEKSLSDLLTYSASIKPQSPWQR